MTDGYRLTSVETVREEGSWLFTVENSRDETQEVFLIPCEGEERDEPVAAWVNTCTHQPQRLHREGVGAVVRDGGIVCPKHGSVFDACSGYCDNGDAAETTLLAVDITVEDGQVYLTDDGVEYLYPGPEEDDDDDDMPSSTSHLSF